MGVFKRGDVYWFEFVFNGERVRGSTKQGNRKAATSIESAYKTKLAKGEVGIFEKKPAPTLREFSKKFLDAVKVRNAKKPRTVKFYREKTERLLEFEPMATSPIDRIGEGLIESYIQKRAKIVAIATVNRELATLRRCLRLAVEWDVIQRAPRIKLLKGEGCREFVLSHEQEKVYLTACPQPLKDVALLCVDTAMRSGEAVNLEWRDVHLEPVGSAKYGYVHIREGKSEKAKRNVPLTPRVREMLQARKEKTSSFFVFASDFGQPYIVTSISHMHEKVRTKLCLSKEFVVHSLRHTMLTRLGEAGADAFTIMKIAGHSSVTVSQRYVHPTPEGLERAMEKLFMLNDRAEAQAKTRESEASETEKSGGVPTKVPTVKKPVAVSY